MKTTQFLPSFLLRRETVSTEEKNPLLAVCSKVHYFGCRFLHQLQNKVLSKRNLSVLKIVETTTTLNHKVIKTQTRT